MKACIQIPKGWKRLREGVPIEEGDRFLDKDVWTNEMSWEKACFFGTTADDTIYIRRIKRKKP